jgi:integrase/recombinase XerD
VTDLVPIAGTIVPAGRPPSVRDVRAQDWNQDTAWTLAVDIWLRSVGSQHSRDAYLRDITLWHNWCREGDVPLDDARRADAEAWRDDLTDAPATIARRLSAVSSFYRYWLAEDVVARNPAQNATRPKVSSAPSSISLSLGYSSMLLAYVDSLTDPRPGVITRLLAETGMRVGELCGAAVTDLTESGGHHVLTVSRKGGEGNRQALPLAGLTHLRVTDYLDGRTEGWLIAVGRTERRQGDGRLDRGYVRRMLRRLAHEAGLPESVWTHMHPHVLRHSAATLMHADNVPVPEIQRVLGHASIETTMRYIHLADDLDGSPVYSLARLFRRGEKP